jgi:hypothetical protein
MNKFNVTIAIIGSVFGIYAGAASVGLDIPRWAWVSEVQASEAKIEDLQLRTEQVFLESLIRRQGDLITRISELEAQGIKVPKSLEYHLENLSDDVRAQKEIIQQLRNAR